MNRIWLEIGSRVRVRDFQDLNSKYKSTTKSAGNLKLPNIHFMLEMKCMCWKVWTINEVLWKSKSYYYKIQFDWMSISSETWLYTREMLIAIPVVNWLEK